MTEIATAAAWKKAATHKITLPSGTKVEIKIPDLPSLIEAGELPQNLLDAALEATGSVGAKPKKPTAEFIAQERQFTDLLVKKTVVKPKLSDEDLPEIPFEDKVLIVNIATRQTDFDAVGEHIAGLHKSESFRKFRNLDSFDSFMEDL